MAPVPDRWPREERDRVLLVPGPDLRAEEWAVRTGYSATLCRSLIQLSRRLSARAAWRLIDEDAP